MMSLNDIPLPIIFEYDGKIIEGFLLYISKEDNGVVIWGVQDNKGDFKKYESSKIKKVIG